MRTLLVYLLAAAALAVGAVFGLPQFLAPPAIAGDEAPTEPQAIPVMVAVAVSRPFADRLEALGEVRANESVEITPNRADHVARMFFEDGQQVEAGQLLVSMNAEEEQALLAEAAALRDERRLAYDRIADLHDGGIASDGELDNVRSLLAAAEARVAGLEAAIQDRQVRAPFAGTLGFRQVSVGAFVQPRTLITTLDDLSVMKLDFTIPETWLSSIRPGMRVDARSDAWPGLAFEGRITVVDTRLDPETRSVTVRAMLANPDRKLRPGMLIKVLVDRGDEPTLQVPEEALVPIGDRRYVYRVGADGIAEQVEIELGRRRVGAIEVLAGIEAGERVVVEGIVRVRPGVRVEVVGERELGVGR